MFVNAKPEKPLPVQSNPVILCRLDDIPDGGTRGYPDTDPATIVLVRSGDEVRAFENRCPHTGAPMEWRRHQFLSFDDYHLACGIHGALFRPDDGFCVAGPCSGASLMPVTVRVVDGCVLLDTD